MKFKVGDVCITTYRGSIHHGYPYGTEVTIQSIAPFCTFAGEDAPYVVGPGEGGGVVHFPEKWLRLKEPPKIDRQELGSWDLCPWHPKEITVE